jgi:uncharacterized damage-inducible protein DinB
VVLQHLIDCEWWWLANLGIPLGERPPKPSARRHKSAQGMVTVFRDAREHLVAVLEALPDTFFEQPVSTSHYPQFRNGAELMLYASQHDFYHLGQINTLELAFREE